MLSITTKSKLSNSTVKQIKSRFPVDLSDFLGKGNILEVAKTTEKTQMILRDGVAIFTVSNNNYVPTVKCVHMVPGILKRVVVDEGAIRPLLNGADLMAPGVLHKDSVYPEVTEHEIVAVYGSGKEHALAVGVVQMDSTQVEEVKSGVAVKLLNRLGDKIYEFTANK